MNKIEIKLNKMINELWQLIRDNEEKLSDFFFGDHDLDVDILIFMHKSLQLISGELLIKKKEYEKYAIKNYSNEDYVDMISESFVQKLPSMDDIEENEKYIEDIRDIMWGYIKGKQPEIWHILEIFDKKDHELSDKEIITMVDCGVIVFIECSLKKRETLLLELSSL